MWVGCHSSVKTCIQSRFVLTCSWCHHWFYFFFSPLQSHWDSFHKPASCSISLSSYTITAAFSLFLCLPLICFSLQEGRYLLGHKSGEAFLTIFKASDGKKPTRSICDLQAVHCGPPIIPEAKVPWVPVDPYHLMPFHKKYCRPPCTFLPRPPLHPKV